MKVAQLTYSDQPKFFTMKIRRLKCVRSKVAYNGQLGRGRSEGVFRLSGACGLGGVRRCYYLKISP